MSRTARAATTRSSTTTRTAATGVLGLLLLGACGTAVTGSGGSTSSTSAAEAEPTGPTPVRLQLPWSTRAQFAGYLAADALGFYDEEGLDVEIVEGGADVVPQTVLAQGQVDYAIAWVPEALASIEQGAGITDVAQIFQRSGTRQVAFTDSGITTPADLAGRAVGSWGSGDDVELLAGLTEAGLDPATEVTLVQQQRSDVTALLAGEVDAAQAMTYDEYARVLEGTDPATGQQYRPEDLVVLDWNETGTAVLQDAIWADTERLGSDEAYRVTTVAFIKASMRGWIHCRDEPEACRDLVVAAGSDLGSSHQLWQVNEVNKLIWPSPDGIGIVDPAAWQRTVEVALATADREGTTVITAEPPEAARTTEYAEEALDELAREGVDATGQSFAPLEVQLNPGGA